ncbi:hypothetical protein LPJ61_003640 [Coemansia biformis]|uniref:CUE domain-containing protein n=1 Tax=Coemansia biformis TaxID=1286918 RepID=A0A9W8CVE0_9FUNG|nr:hypothetical protein LPJ61_003640 [Coemansia biformis]
MTEHQVERQEREHAEKLKSIMELFPEMSQEVVDTILFNNHGQVDTTINALLSMSDTSYKPDDADIARQEELRRDEAFARRLAENELHSLSSSDGIAGSPAHRRNHSDSNSNGRRAPAASNANVVDLLSEDANSTLAAYAPLRPLKHVPRSPNASTPISPIAPVTPETPMSPIVPVGPPALEHHGVEPHIDLDNPFDDNPLLHIPGAVSSRPVTATRGELLHGSGNQSPSHLHTNPFGLPSDGAVLPDNNPFRSRRS